MLRATALLVTAACVLGGPAASRAEDPAAALALIKPPRIRAAKPFAVPGLGPAPVRLGDHTGKVVFLNFWATWCPPCKDEMPSMERLYQRLRARGLVVVALSVDAEGAPVVAPFVKEHKLTFPIGLDPDMSVASQYGVRALPSTFIIDRRGDLVALAIGPREWDAKASYAFFESMLGR
jgi:peroxiredoxin